MHMPLVDWQEEGRSGHLFAIRMTKALRDGERPELHEPGDAGSQRSAPLESDASPQGGE